MRDGVDSVRDYVGHGKMLAKQFMDNPNVYNYDETIKNEVNCSLDAICNRLVGL